MTRAAGAGRPERAGTAIVLAALAGALAACADGRDAPQGGAAAVSDVILVVIDTCRQDSFGCYGNPYGRSPEIDRFARGNVRFDRAIATSPWTLPSFASLLTSRMPTVHGAYRSGQVHAELRDGVPSGVEMLRERGFRTSALANAAFLDPTFGLARGFEKYDFRPAESEDLRRAGETVDLALDRLEESPDAPDFLLLHLFDPHMPYDPPGVFRSLLTADYEGDWSPPLKLHRQTMDPEWMPGPEDFRYMRLIYESEVAYVSREVGRLFEGLRERGLWDDALVLLTSDHGEEFREHGGWQHGHSYHDEVIRVPLLMKLPAGMEPARSVVGAQVSLLDVMPTVFDVVDGDVPESLRGETLLPLVTGSDAPHHRMAVSERNRREGEQISLRDDRYVFIWDLERDTGRLYDWREDPGELHDLASERPEEAERMRAVLAAERARMEAEAEEAGAREVVSPAIPLQEQLESLGYVGD
jgi:arylsulfatase A-like enzyme